ncbi:MAG: AmmeMemoRadiSam system protein B [Treponema sp.]|nr:AmmeMemoRadiSam system protein B [Treponema sp.]
MKKIKSFLKLLPAVILLSSCASFKTGGKVFKAGYVYQNDRNMWNHIFKMAEPYVVPQIFPSSVILPHHDITERQLNSFYSAVSSINNHPSVIVMLCTDHFEQGKKNITVPKNTSWLTPDGELCVNEKLLSSIINTPELKGKVSSQDKIWNIEHGIFIHTPFLKHYFPDTEIIPFLLKGFSSDRDFEDYIKLGQVLANKLPEDAFVVASVDLSHYQIPAWTDIHDEVTENTIQNMENPRHLEIDSPESISCLFEYNYVRGYTKPVLIHKTSTYDFIPEEKVVCTSHQYWSFFKQGIITEEEEKSFKDAALKNGQRINECDYENQLNQNILLLGSGNMNEGIREFWYWDRYKKSDDPSEILLHEMAGSEARFLTGFDAIIFDPPAGTVYTKKLHGTTLTVFSTGVNLEGIGTEEKKSPELKGLVINARSGEEYPPEEKAAALLSLYDFILFRSEDDSKDVLVFIKKAGKDFEVQKFNLGILYSKEKRHIRGAVLSLSWKNGILTPLSISYESENGIPPAIEQYSGEP